MEELREKLIEILLEFDGMTPEAIEELRVEWIEELKAENSQQYLKKEKFANIVCDVGVDMARRAQHNKAAVIGSIN